MQELFRVFWDIALFRRGPRDVPASWLLLAIVAAVYAATSSLQSVLLFGPRLAVERGLADLALTAALFWTALALRRRGHRFLQTLTAMLGTGTLLSVPMITMLIVRRELTDAGAVALLLSVASVPLLVWYLFVVGHIVRHALEVPLFTGMAVAMTYIVLGYLLIEQLPAAAAA
ncbi:MAG TPA: hypothetical protein VN790_06725 [Steroidobacteraceae bacterium]|nr:hypothetical protein [Steroidobacteraceae bacterium]